MLQATYINVFYGLANLIRGQVTAKITPSTWWANMEQGWVWDLDEFVVHHVLDVDAVVGSKAHGRVKPHASIFVAALQMLGVGPEETVMVGDSYEDDIEGARDAMVDFSNGWIVAGVGYGIWLIVVVANVYVLVELMLGND